MTLIAERPTAQIQDDQRSLVNAPGYLAVDLTGYEEFAGRKLFTRDDCDFLERLGILTERYELVDGQIIIKMGANPPHSVVMTLMSEWLSSVFGGKYIYNQAQIEIISEDQTTNRPLPDFAVLIRPATEFVTAFAGPGDICLIIEVSDTTLALDLRSKSKLYARAGISEYWIADIIGRRFIVQTDPDRESGKYRNVVTYGESESIASLAAPDQPLMLTNVLPPREAESVEGAPE